LGILTKLAADGTQREAGVHRVHFDRYHAELRWASVCVGSEPPSAFSRRLN